MSNLNTILRKIQKCPNGSIKDAIIALYEAIEWIITVLDEEREQ